MTRDATQSLSMHLLELRKRLLRILLVVFALCAGMLGFSNEIYQIVATPLLNALPAGSQMIATEVASPFLTPFKLTAVCAVFIAIPYILGELWAFIAPGLYSAEKKLLLPVMISSIGLFYAGIAFAYYVVFPLIFTFFSASSPEGVAYMPDISQFFNTVLKLFFAFGVAFEIPIITIMLTYTGAINVNTIARKRPYVIVGCFVVGMLLTPPDPISQALMAIPMWLLFELGLLFSRLLPKKDSAQDSTNQSTT